MPELVEVERYRQLALKALDRKIAEVHADDAWYLKRGTTREELIDTLVGNSFDTARRIGKLLLLDIADGGVLAMRFGMSGTLMVDTKPGITDLMYSSHRAPPEWNRFALTFEDGGNLAINDPRRLGGVELDADESRLGHDASDITVANLKGGLGKK